MPLVVKIILIVLSVPVGLAAVVLLLSLIRIGVIVEYDDEGFRTTGKLGALRLDLARLGGKISRKHGSKKDKTVSGEKGEKTVAKKGKLSDFKPLIGTFFEAFGKFIKHFRVKRLKMDITVGGEDPFALAMDYGKIAALIGAFFPLSESVLDRKGTDVNVGFDFSLAETMVSCTAELRIRIIWLAAAAFGPAMKLREMKKEKAVKV